MLFMKSQIFLFIKVALSGREAAERFSISLFLQSNWGARKWSGPLCFLFCHDEKENSIVFVFDIAIVFVFDIVIVFVFVFVFVNFFVMSCFLITLNKCLNGHKYLGLL